MQIAVDAMGGDRAPQVIVEGAVQAAREKKAREIILVGDQAQIEKELAAHDIQGLPITIHHASEVIEMGESPVLALRKKKNASIPVCVDLARDGKADAIVSAGNTGAAVAATMLKWRALKGVERPAIAIVVPAPNGIFVLLDAGANSDCRPKHLLQFAVMGDVYSRTILNIRNPRVGLLSIGEEASKGNELTRESFKLLEKSRLNFFGNIEGKDVFENKVDVIVCDGFVGNIVLKLSEGLAMTLPKVIKREVTSTLLGKIGGLLIKPSLRRIKKTWHYEQFGGAPLLGVNGRCIIAHGASTPVAIRNAINVAEEYIVQKVNERIIQAIGEAQSITPVW